DEAEHAVFDPVPLAGAGRIVADRDAQTGLCGETGELDFPGSDPVAVGAASVGGDQQPVSVGEPGPTHRVPPPSNGLDGELGGVGDVTDGNPALVVGHVVDPVRDGLGMLDPGPVGEVVHLHPFRFAGGRPFYAAVGVVADQLLF